MIILYDKFKTSGFDRNDLVLRNATKCEVTWEKNGQYQIDLIYPIVAEDNAWKSIVKGAIVKCPVPHQQDQLFRLNTPTKKMDENGTYFYIEATGYHITYDLSYNFLVGAEISSKTGVEAGEYILSNTQYTHEFSWLGDISTVGTAYYVRQNPIDALIGSEDNAYVNVWGGELVRDNFTIGMFNKAGENRGVSITYSKNITGFEQAADDSNLITRAMPYITDDSSSSDSSSNNSDSTTIITLPEQFIDSPKIEDYANIYVKDVEVTLTDDQKNYTTEQKYEVMRDYVNNMYENQNIDIPIYSYTLDFVELCKTEEYKNFAVIEEVHPYDFIVVKALDVDVIAELVGYKYDAIAQLYEEVTLGNVKNDIVRSNEKSLFQLSKQNQQNIKILQAQMGEVPGTILNIASTTTSGGNNLFDHSVLDNQYASEWSISQNASIIDDATLHDTDKVFEMPPGTSISKNDVLLNPNNYYGQQLMFSLQAKYSGLTIIDSGAYNSLQQTKVLLGALDAVIQRCLVNTTGTTWNYSSAGNTIVSEKVGVTGGTAITVTNSSSYSYTIHAWDNQGNQLPDFKAGPIPSTAFYIQVELQENIYPSEVKGFSIFEANPYTSQGIVSIYANSSDSDWAVQEQTFYFKTEHPSDIIKQVNFRANNGDASGNAYIAAFMINTGSVRSDYSQSSNDTVETLRAHQAVFDSLSATYATIENLDATNATISNLNTSYAHITNGTIDNATIDVAKVNNLSATYATITSLNTTNATISSLKASVGNVIDLTAGTLKAGSVIATNIQTGTITASSGIIANGAITTAMIGTGAVNTAQIADGSITDAKIVGLTANKITAGTIDASQITVTNLNAANITVGTINGQQIAPGAITATQLANGAVGTSQLSSSVNNTIQSAISQATTANTNASTALTAANGKNKNYYSSTAPTGGTYNNGDLWFNTANGNQISQWNGSAWGVTQLGSAALTSLDAGVITTGILNANRIGTNTITADKLLVGDFTNLAVANELTGANVNCPWTTTTISNGYVIRTSDAIEYFMITNQTLIPFRAGEQLYFEFRAISNANVTCNFSVWTYDGNGNNNYHVASSNFTIGTTESLISGYITVPNFDATTTVKFVAGLDGITNCHVQLRKIFLRRVTDSTLIEDGSITTSKIISSAITTDKIAAGAVQANNIASNTITAAQIQGGTITATQIQAGTITGDRLVNNTITTAQLAAKCITANQMAANSVTAASIQTNTITAAQIASGTITSDLLYCGGQLNNVAQNVAVVYSAGNASNGGMCAVQSQNTMGTWTTTTMPSTATVDLGSIICQIQEISFDTYFPTDNRFIPLSFKLEYSNDNSTWTSIVDITNNISPANTNMRYSVGISARYIRLTVRACQSGQTSVAITNFKVNSRQGGTIINGGMIQAQSITSSSACIASLNASWLKSGTIDANVIDVINLNAQNITSGTISVDMISSGGTISGNSIKTSDSGEYALLENNSLGIWREFSGGEIPPTWGIQLSSSVGESSLMLNSVEPTGMYLTSLTIDSNNGACSITGSSHITSFNIVAPSINIKANTGCIGFNVNGATDTGIVETTNAAVLAGRSSTWIKANTYYNGVSDVAMGSGQASQLWISPGTNSPQYRTSSNAPGANGTLSWNPASWLTVSQNIGAFTAIYGSTNYVQVSTTDGHGAWGINMWASDVSLKTNIQDSTEDALSKICEIPMRSFAWKETGEVQKLGLISQEAMEVEKAFAFGVEQKDGNTIYQPDTSILIPYMIKSIQQLNDKIVNLEDEIEALKSEKAS